MEWLRCRYTHYGLDKLNTKEHQAMALRAAREGIALLKNQNLPDSWSLQNLMGLMNRFDPRSFH